MKKLDIYISHSKKMDYKNKLYNPLLKSKIGKENNLILPRTPQYNNIDTKDVLANSDVLIAEVTIPGTGVGIEIGRAQCCNVKILCLLKKGEKCSTSVRRVCENIIEYSSEDEMIYKITKFLNENF
ncbi:MAG: hypothetical protein RSB76_01610 [Clostridia bacterium]